MAVERVSFGAPDGWAGWAGGSGPPMLLLHGGWAGAQAHWSAVWESLAQYHRVIAPDLPGIVNRSSADLTDYASYVRRLQELAEEQRIDGAVVVGNSFGATLAYLFALRSPARCSALVMVDGFPPPEVPAPLRWLMSLRPFRRRALAHMRRHIYGEEALRNGFDDAAKAPTEVRRALEEPDEQRIEHMLDVVLNSRRIQDRPGQPTLIVWGAEDRLPKAELTVGRRLHKELRGSQFEVIQGAGHMPQVEQPDDFLRVLRNFIGSL